MPELKSTLRVLNEPDLEWRMREDKQGTIKILVGNDERPSEKLRVHLNIFKAGAQEPVHWHLVEALYYVISGHAVLEDLEGQKHEVGPGSAIYHPPGIAGEHGWDFKEALPPVTGLQRPTPDAFESYEDYLDARDECNKARWTEEVRHQQMATAVSSALDSQIQKFHKAASQNLNSYSDEVLELRTEFQLDPGETPSGENWIANELVFSPDDCAVSDAALFGAP